MADDQTLIALLCDASNVRSTRGKMPVADLLVPARCIPEDPIRPTIITATDGRRKVGEAEGSLCIFLRTFQKVRSRRRRLKCSVSVIDWPAPVLPQALYVCQVKGCNKRWVAHTFPAASPPPYPKRPRTDEDAQVALRHAARTLLLAFSALYIVLFG